MWWGYKAEKKFDDIFIRFDTIPAVTDGHVVVAKTALAERRAGKKHGPFIIYRAPLCTAWY